MNTARVPATLELARYEKRLIQSLKEVRGGCTRPSKDTYVNNLVADLISKGRLACVRQLLAIIYNAKARGTPKASARAFADEWLAVIEDMYGEAPAESPDAVNIAEEAAEGPHEVAQMRLMVERSGQAARAFLSANRFYCVANEGVVRYARRILTGGAA